ncbi:MAG TPA: YggS family pyridoxal phosphate-dependent enzyme [Candidatus Xenobia bacterium]
MRTRLTAIRERIEQATARSVRPAGSVRLVAIGKGQPVEALREAAALGVTDMGENYLQEARTKIPAMQGVTWHFTGHLQSNKAGEVVRLFDVIQTVDSRPLLERLDRLAERPLQALIQIRLGGETQKSGIEPDELPALLQASQGLSHIKVVGLMTLPPPVPGAEQSRHWFRQLAALGREHGLAELSMGMSDDFEVAIEEGATMVRIGTALYGERL